MPASQEVICLLKVHIHMLLRAQANNNSINNIEKRAREETRSPLAWKAEKGIGAR